MDYLTANRDLTLNTFFKERMAWALSAIHIPAIHSIFFSRLKKNEKKGCRSCQG